MSQIFKSPVCVDFFLETYFVRKSLSRKQRPRKKGTTNLLIKDAMDKYEGCLRPSKIECPSFGNVRMHYIDLRSRISANSPSFYSRGHKRTIHENYLYPQAKAPALTIITTEARFRKVKFGVRKALWEIPDYRLAIAELKKQLKSKRGWEHYQESVRYVLGQTQKKPSGYQSLPSKSKRLMDVQREKIQKQWLALGPELQRKLKPKIKNFVEKYLEFNGRTRRVILNTPDFDMASQIGTFFILLIIFPAVMDVYFLLRMLKPSLSDSHIVVAYAGDLHIRSYARFLGGLKFCRPIWKRPMDSKCIEIPHRVIKEVNSLVKTFPKSRCSYPRVDEIHLLAKHFGRSEAVIKTCLKETAEILSLSEDEVLRKVWQATSL